MKNTEDVARALIIAADRYGIIPVLYHVFGNKVTVRIDIRESVCNAPVEELNLDTRGHNALGRARMTTVGEVVDMLNEGTMMRIRSLGRKTFADIQAKTLHFAYQNASAGEKQRFARALIELNVDQYS